MNPIAEDKLEKARKKLRLRFNEQVVLRGPAASKTPTDLLFQEIHMIIEEISYKIDESKPLASYMYPPGKEHMREVDIARSSALKHCRQRLKKLL